MAKKRNLVVANWKMNPESQATAKSIFNSVRSEAKKIKNTEIVICPPFVYLQTLSKLKFPKNILFGAQNLATEAKGAFTGEVSAPMIKDSGGKFVIVGHSERRAMGETNDVVRKKLEAAFSGGLTPILCIGEKDRDRDGNHLSFIKNQIKECLYEVQKKNLVGLIIAYEPIWAIGRSYKDSMNPTDIHETSLYIEKVFGELFGRDIALSLRILYGGSVEPENAGPIIEYGNVSGFLVGHSSLVSEQFSKILKATDIKK